MEQNKDVKLNELRKRTVVLAIFAIMSFVVLAIIVGAIVIAVIQKKDFPTEIVVSLASTYVGCAFGFLPKIIDKDNIEQLRKEIAKDDKK
jgi:uncharacterized membrane protein YqjE